MNARSEFTNRRSPGVLSLMKSFDGRVIDTGCRFQIAVPALNQPPLRPTRGSGEGGVVDMSGAPESATPFIEALRAQAASASAPIANETCHSFDFMSDRGGEGWGGRTYRALSPSIRRMRSISVVWSALTSDANRKTYSSCPAPGLAKSRSTIVIAP